MSTKATTGYRGVDFWEEECNVRNISTTSEKRAAYALRHQVFARELRWVPPQQHGLENDKYDQAGLIPLGVFDSNGAIVAHLRITPPRQRFMMENEFSNVIGDACIEKSDSTVEVSRLCILADVRKLMLGTPYGLFNLSMLLYKGLYQWCLLNNIARMYMVVEYKLFRLLRMHGFPCEAIAEPVSMKDGVLAVAIVMDWRLFEALNRDRRYSLLQWFSDQGTAQLAVA